MPFSALNSAIGNFANGDRRATAAHSAASHVSLGRPVRAASAEQAQKAKADPYGESEEAPMAVHEFALGSTIAQPAIERGWMRVRCRPEFAS